MHDVKITKADNGFVMVHSEEIEDGIERSITEVIACYGDERRTMTQLLLWMGQHFGSMDIVYDKFGKDNLRISWDRKGHKVE